MSQSDFPDIDPTLPAGHQVVIRAVKELNPQTEIELANALSTMIDLDEYLFARYFLGRMKSLELTDSQRFEIYETLGSSFFLSLHSNEGIQPEGRAFAEEILYAAHRQATHPDRLKQLVKRLSDADRSVRNATIRTLRKLGPAATAEMLHAFSDPQRQAEYPFLQQALPLMGDDALGPLLGATRASNLEVQAAAIEALATYRTPESTNVLQRTFLAAQTPVALRNIAQEGLSRSDRLPVNSAFVSERLYQQAYDLLLGRQKLSQGLLGEVTLWRWNKSENRLLPQTVPTATAVRLSAAQTAADLYEIEPQLPRNRELYLLTQLESTKRTMGPGLSIDVAAITQSFGEIEPTELDQLLTTAIKLGLIPAATACCELMGELGTSDLLLSSTDKPRALIEAILVGDRHLQFAAFEAIHKLDPQTPFVGSSYVLSLAVFLASSEGHVSGLVGDNRIDIAQSYAAMLQAERLTGIAANTGQELFSLAINNPDVELIVITDSLTRPYYLELIQQLRNDMRTKRLPIALLTRDNTTSLRLQHLVINDPLFMFLPMSLEPELVGSQVRRIKGLTTPWTVGLVDRQQHTETAINWLRKIASDRTRYRFYDLGSRQKELARILYLPGMAEQGSQILQALGTPSAQRELLNFVGQSNFPIEARQAAAKAFVETLKTGGAMLTRDEILQQYDRYNASEREPVESQQLLGSILDALESRQAGNRNN